MENDNKLLADEQLYEKAKEYCRRLKPEMRGDIYYALLDWCDRRKDIVESLAKKNDKYQILYISDDGVSHIEEFSTAGYENPYLAARRRYGEIIQKDTQVAELRHCPNPYIHGIERLGSLIFSYEREENK